MAAHNILFLINKYLIFPYIFPPNNVYFLYLFLNNLSSFNAILSFLIKA